LSNDTAKLEITSDLRVLLATEKAGDSAKKIGLSEVDRTKVQIAVSELANNILHHAQGKGTIIVCAVKEHDKVGIMVTAEDLGPGIADLKGALEGRNHTKRGLGQGLGAVNRLMDEFKIVRRTGGGTTIIAKKWKC
jgi:serine/threonine-protein kinase RsbT